ncbi:MAG: hypothetical protein KDC02_20905 [Flavobacteriales bacterium]|nr:hypothetical protein [Flavobacteriales bacterium]
MLRTYLFCLLTFSSGLALAQGTLYNALSYQAVARDANGDPIAGQIIGLRFRITAGPGIVYDETQSVTTNALGLFKADIGTGTPNGFPPLQNYPWYHPSNDMYLLVYADFTGGTNYQFLGQEPIRAVPVASTARMATTLLDSSAVVDPNTNVIIVDPTYRLGIGTAAPPANLTVLAPSAPPQIPGATSSGALRVGPNVQEGVDLGKLATAPFSGWVQSGFDGTFPDPLSLQPLGGSVGIGTLTPGATLDVNGNFRLADGTEGPDKVLVSDANGNTSWTDPPRIASGNYFTTWTTVSGFTMAPSDRLCTYSRVGNLVTVVCRFGGDGPMFSAGTNIATITLPPSLDVDDTPGGRLISGTFASDHYRNGSDTEVGIVAYENNTSVRIKINGSNAGDAGAWCNFSYLTSAP